MTRAFYSRKPGFSGHVGGEGQEYEPHAGFQGFRDLGFRVCCIGFRFADDCSSILFRGWLPVKGAEFTFFRL